MNSFSVPDAAIRLNQASSKDREAFGQMFDSFAGQAESVPVEQAKVSYTVICHAVTPMLKYVLVGSAKRYPGHFSTDAFATE